MARYVKGGIVMMPFPFSEDTDYKHRPALVLASWDYAGSTDYLVCPITTQLARDPFLTKIEASDTIGAALTQTCYLRPAYLFATGERFITRKLDHLKPAKLAAVIDTIVKIVREQS